MAELTIAVPRNLWLSSNGREHRMKVQACTRDLRALGFAAARLHRLPKFERVHVAAFIAYPTARKADPPNAWPTVKALTDGALVDAGTVPDDNSEHVVAWSFHREARKSDKGTYRVRLVLTDQDTPFGTDPKEAA